MRHIPEEELHAYLDQALSRSQCVEIESHLADCPRCRSERDAIAALRDRTTALLAQLAPPVHRPPSFTHLAAEAERRAASRRHRLVRLGWAASLAAALGLGWVARDLTPPADLAQAPSPAAPELASATTPSPQDPSPEPRPAPAGGRDQAEGAAAPRAVEPVEPPQAALAVPAPSGMALRSVGAVREPGTVALDGLWRTMSWDRLQRDSAAWVPHVDGLPVTEVQMSGSSGGGITVVAQQLASGETIRTVAGPAADVSSLLSRGRVQATTAPLESVPGEASAPAILTRDAAGGRMLAVFGPVSPDSLRAYLLRVR